MNNRGCIVPAILSIIIIVFIAIWLVGLVGRECSTDSQCGEDQYCGSDFSCHQFKVVEKIDNNMQAALILGISIIAAAYIFRGGKLPKFKRRKKDQSKDQSEQSLGQSIYEAYYENQLPANYSELADPLKEKWK